MFVNGFIAIGFFLLMATAIRLLLEKTFVRKAIGLVILGHSLHLLILVAGLSAPQDKVIGTPAFKEAGRLELMVDPLPQALILTSIVLSFGLLSVFLIYELSTAGKEGNKS